MAFSAYKHRSDVQDKLGIRVDRSDFIPKETVGVEPMAWLSQYLHFADAYNSGSEKARSEFLIAPILVEAIRPFQDTFSVVSGPTLEASDALSREQGLFGALDFVVCREKQTFELQRPIVVVLEAKKSDLDLGYWQCAAEMVAARRYNEKNGDTRPTMYGCVSIGELWRFLRLQGDELRLEQSVHSISDLPALLGAWHAILNAAKIE